MKRNTVTVYEKMKAYLTRLIAAEKAAKQAASLLAKWRKR